MTSPTRNLVLILGDQLDPLSSALDGFDPSRDRVWMAEVSDEAERVWSHKARIALFLSAMRHFRELLEQRGYPVVYRALERHCHASLAAALAEDLQALSPQRVIFCQPGEYGVRQSLMALLQQREQAWQERPDTHFYCEPADFARWAGGRKSLRLEHFYRWMRRREGVLMTGEQPEGERWNFDADNRQSFGSAGPPARPPPLAFPPDALTAEVLALVQQRFPDHPGSLADFDWPVTAAEAEQALEDFVCHRLAGFGRWQDALWTGEPWLFHSRLSAAMNLKLLDPRRVVAAAVAAWRGGHAPLAAVEGFVRQILGWREYVRGLYWLDMPGYLDCNALAAEAPLPDFYWTGDTDMVCLRETLGQTLRFGHAHHIQRLMITGLFALLLGVRPKEVHAWYLAIYVDAVEWVELPNVIGMSQHADGGRMASKPYCASGRYIQRMSNYCEGCRYRPELALGDDACPFTTLYWDFLARHQARFANHPRSALEWRNLARKDPEWVAAVRAQAAELKASLATDVPD